MYYIWEIKLPGIDIGRRARHVKCDEIPGACKNCTSTGQSCEGYDAQRVPLPDRNGGRNVRKYTEPGDLLLMEPGVGIQWTMTSDEQRCFSHFQHKLLPALGGWFDSTLWNTLVLQLGVMERAVCYLFFRANARAIRRGISAPPEWHLASRAFNFSSIAMFQSEQDVMLNYGRLEQQQQQVLSELARFSGRFSPLRE